MLMVVFCVFITCRPPQVKLHNSIPSYRDLTSTSMFWIRCNGARWLCLYISLPWQDRCLRNVCELARIFNRVPFLRTPISSWSIGGWRVNPTSKSFRFLHVCVHAVWSPRGIGFQMMPPAFSFFPFGRGELSLFPFGGDELSLFPSPTPKPPIQL